MQIIKDIEQGSQEWLELRKGILTASNFCKIITGTGKESTSLKDYALNLASEKLLTTIEEGYKNEAMQRGNDLEKEARQFYQEQTLNIVEQVTFIKSDCGNFGYSPDGLINNGLIEIKCPLANNHLKYLIDNKCPTNYIPQVQGGLWLSEKEYCDFISYHPKFIEDKKMFKIRVYRDEEFIAKLSELASKTIELRDNILNKL